MIANFRGVLVLVALGCLPLAAIFVLLIGKLGDKYKWFGLWKYFRRR
jgi:hypothetical protein